MQDSNSRGGVLVRVARYLEKDPGTVGEVLTIGAAAAILVVDGTRGIPEEKLANLTIAVLLLIAITGLAERLTRLRRIDRNSEETRGILKSRQDKLAERCDQTGVTWIYDALTDVPLQAGIEDARSVRILQTWTGNAAGLKEVLRRSASKGCRVRILLLDPDSEQASYRSRSMGHKADQSSNAIRVDLHIFAELCADPSVNGRIEVGVYDALPAFSLYAFDDVRILGLFWRKWFALESPQFRIEGTWSGPNTRARLVDRIDTHFDDLWNNSKTRFLTPRKDGDIELKVRAGGPSASAPGGGADVGP